MQLLFTYGIKSPEDYKQDKSSHSSINYQLNFILIFFFLFTVRAFAGNAASDKLAAKASIATGIQAKAAGGSIKGTVKTSDGQPAESVTVSIKGIASTAVDKNGNFYLKNIPAGNYTLTASFVGLGTQTRQVRVEEGQTLEVNFVLTESGQQLNEVVVRMNKPNQLAQKESETVARMPLLNLENPQVYSVVNSKLFEQQVTTSFDDALKTAAGLVSGGGSPGTRSNSYLRGFSEQAFFRDGKMIGSWAENDMANIDYVEVIKGPSGTLFGGHGRTNYGGLINRVTKKPYDSFGGSLSLISGNNAYNRFTADVNSPLSKDSALLGRVNAAYRKEKSFQDYGWTESTFIAPAFSYQASKRLKFVLEADVFKVKGADRGNIFSATGITNVNQLNRIHNLSFSSNEIVNSKQTSIFSADAIYKISDSWTSTTSYGFSHSDYDYNYVALDIEGETINRGLGTARYDNEFTNIQQNFNGDFKIGNMRNRLLVGLDYLRDDEIYVGGTAAYDSFSSKQVAPYISAENFANALNVPSGASGYTNNRYSAYVSNVIDLIPALHLMTSLRYEYSKEWSPDAVLPATKDPAYSFGQGAWTPKFGLVYEILPKQLSVFGNYMGGIKNVNSFLANDGTGNGRLQKAVPEKAEQWEGGIKSSLMQDKLSLMVSYFDIKVDNILRTDPANMLFSLQDGTQANKGVEFELIANPVQGLDIMAGYAYLDAKFLNGSSAGKRPTYIPKNTFNYWLNYQFKEGGIKGLGLGIGGNYRGAGFVTADNSVIIPEIYTMDASLFFDHGRYRISLKADNFTNKLYWGDYLNPQALRTVKGSLTFKF